MSVTMAWCNNNNNNNNNNFDLINWSYKQGKFTGTI